MCVRAYVRFYLPPCVQGGSVRGKGSPGNGCSQKVSGLGHEGRDAGGGFNEVFMGITSVCLFVYDFPFLARGFIFVLRLGFMLEGF